ncbi:SDR family NAD(P)-dependent oxidoreductase [Luteimicrobium xylanilyticum]|uniref:Probable oxidoreductase n=1 Tax=Luteimicrobium xylanilyticum TaxID=1133546 RepID=A0A5P9QAJ2_9MICO|nr:SDR family NAD(P)-dependent oxidoreductase [Luteimicrobium xylanilyticum]QFU98478.1 Protochlorophyllide reductase [Luteimicrobium xylanilyticum]
MTTPPVSRPVTSPFGARTTAIEVVAGLDLTGKQMIVTGGASGLGAATVDALARAGAAVTVAVRDPDAVAPASESGLPVRVAQLDLVDLDSIARFVDGWTGPVDALVANAGVMAVPDLRTTSTGWELQLGVNFLGHFALALGLHDRLAEARGRVVVVSSGAQLRSGVDLDDLNFESRPYDPWVAYAQSKSADVLLAVGIARHWAAEGITANACAPGFIHTNLQRHVPPEAMRAMGVLDDDGALIHPPHYKTPAEGAATAVFLATSPLVAGVTGAYFEDGQESSVVEGGTDAPGGVAAWSVDPVRADALWDRAQDAVAGHVGGHVGGRN